MFKRFKKENKAKLEHKLYLARENPDPIFDISECDLRNVPTGIYSLCRVFLKEQLALSHNNLSSLNGGGSLGDLRLLQILAINNNAFTHLPDEIQLLSNLKELYIQNNLIKKLPSALCCLANLQLLNASNNLLKELPQELGNLLNLNTLILVGNDKLKCLPKSMCQAQCLRVLNVDYKDFIYPPESVVEQGVMAVMKFICDDNNIEYEPKDSVEIDKCDEMKEDPHVNIEAKVWELEKIKEQKLQDFLAIERHNELMQRQELELANLLKLNREKLLADITEQQSRFDESLDKFQQIKDFERFKLIEQLKEVEENADVAIKQLLQLNREPHALLLEQESAEQDKILAAANKYNDNLCKRDIIDSMQELLEKESERFEHYCDVRVESSKTILEQDVQYESQLMEIFQAQDDKNKKLAVQLQEDGDLQKVAVAALLERSDARTWSLLQQVKFVEAQLAALTVIEMDRKNLEIHQRVNDLAEKRVSLSILLLELLEQQGERRAQLLSTLHTLEENKQDSTDYWLRAYQQLLNRMPQGFNDTQRNMDPALIEALLLCGVLNYLPFLAKLSQNEAVLVDLTEDDLCNVGIVSSTDRASILSAFEAYKRRHIKTSIPNPSAPPDDEENEASAPTTNITQSYSTSECVVCMDHKCEIIYVPCGHFCCCTKCSAPISDCPMCRTPIERLIKVDQS